MNRFPRVRLPKKNEGRVRVAKSRVDSFEVEEVFATKSKERPQSLIADKDRKSRCTYYRPSNEDFGQLTEERPLDNYRYHLKDEFGFDPLEPETADQLKKFKALFSNYNALPNDVCPHHGHVAKESPARIDGYSDTHEEFWQDVDTTEDLDRYLNRFKDVEVQNDFLVADDNVTGSTTTFSKNEHVSKVSSFPNNVRISTTPRVKVIAEKFSKFKRNNVELRKLEDKVVCLEYDIYDRDSVSSKPFQKMRAFFSIKPIKKGKINENGEITKVPSDVKRLFVMMDDVSSNKFDRKEIEIIDGKIPENRSLLEDLKKVLRRKRALQNRKKRATLDLMSMYEMAKREKVTLDEDYSNTNLLSKAELQEIKELIITRCGSSVQGISRRKIKSDDVKKDSGDNDALMISESMIAELMREPEIEI